MTHNIPDDDDLDVCGPPTTIPPQSSSPFTGTLVLFLPAGMGPTARRLLDLPNGLHFRTLSLPWLQEGDLVWINALMVECSDTLESLRLTHHLTGAVTWLLLRNQYLTSVLLFAGSLVQSSVDLSKATRLQNIKFSSGSPNPQWITMALHTVTPKHRDLQHISLPVPYSLTRRANIRQAIGEVTHGHWLDLDRLLVGFWESHSIRPKISYVYTPWDEKKVAVECISCLLPEITKRGIIDFAV